MAKKFYDIIPPRAKSSRKTKPAAKQMKSGVKRVSKKNLSMLSRIIWIAGAVVVLVLAVCLYFGLASAEIKIWPKTEQVNFEQNILVDSSIKAVDEEKAKVPGQFIEEEKEFSQEFPATGSGSNEGVASGIIKVYNKYTPASPITLRSGTHFMSDSGKYFVADDKVVIPAAKSSKGSVIPGSISIKVHAIESGESYNIEASKFSVPKLAGTPYFYSIYAESTEKMTGGFESQLKVVTEDDINGAKEALKQKITDDLTEALKARAASSELIIFNNALLKNIEDLSCAVKAKAEIDKFNCSVKAKFSALVFAEADLLSLSRKYVEPKIDGSKIILDKSLEVNAVTEKIDLKNGTISLNSKITAEIYPKVTVAELSSDFAGKTSDQISDIIGQKFNQEANKINIKLWPFWVQKAPKDLNKIKVELLFQ